MEQRTIQQIRLGAIHIIIPELSLSTIKYVLWIMSSTKGPYSSEAEYQSHKLEDVSRDMSKD